MLKWQDKLGKKVIFLIFLPSLFFASPPFSLSIFFLYERMRANVEALGLMGERKKRDERKIKK